MLKKMQIDLVPATFKLLRLLLAVTIWSCHVWVAPAVRLCHGSDAEPHPQGGALKLKFLNPRPRSRNKFGMTEKAETNRHVMLNLFQHPVCFFSTFSRRTFYSRPQDGVFRRGLNKPSTPRPLEPLNPSGFTLIELIAVMVIIGILAAVVLPRIDFGGTSSRASVDGAAYIIASDIRYVQECAMVNRVSKSITFTLNQNFYTFPATAPSTSSLDPSGRLPSGATISSATYTLIFNSLGEPTSIPTGSPYYADLITVSAGGLSRTIRIWSFTGKVEIL